MSGLLVTAVALYAAYWTHFYPGYFGDDAAYLEGARSLLHGSFRALYILHAPPETHFLPGYSFLLAPFVLLLGLTHPLLRLVPLSLTLLCSVLMARFFRRWLSPLLCFVSVLFFALNPVTALYSTTFMSEPFYLAACLATLCLVPQVMEDDSPKPIIALALMLLWTMLTRPIGALLWVSVVVGLMTARRWKATAIVGGLAFFLWSLFMMRNRAVSGSANDYLRFWKAEFLSLSGVTLLLRNFLTIMQKISINHMLNVGVWAPPNFWPIAFVMLALCVVGIVAGFRRQAAYRSLWIVVVIYVALYLIVHGLWLTFEDRYALPLLPFLFVFFILGVDTVLSISGIHREIGRVACIGVFLIPGWITQHAVTIDQTFSATRPAESWPPTATMQWIKDHIPNEETLCARALPRLYLFTGRSGIGQPVARDREEARFLLLNSNVHTVLLESGHVLSLSGESLVANQEANEQRFGEWVRQWPEIFTPVYDNPKEGTGIFTLKADDHYTESYLEYASARTAFQMNHPDEAFAALDRALKATPTLASALSLYGAALIVKGGDDARAERYLRQSLSLMPDYPLSELNLARLALIHHHAAEAEHWIEETRRSIATPSSAFRNLLPALDLMENSISHDQ